VIAIVVTVFAPVIPAAASSPSHPVSNVLLGVSCVDADWCMAVGYTSTTLGPNAVPTTTLVERWDGQHWTIVASPNPAGAKNTQLAGVSCKSASSCVAVGFTAAVAPNHRMPLVERWSGRTWSIDPVPKPPGTDGPLASVSCTSTAFCIAVGYDFAIRWDSGRWTTLATGTAPGAYAVSCTSATSCYAVGGNIAPQRWDGTTWAIAPRDEPGRGTMLGMMGVSCRSAVTCQAVGYTTGSQQTKAARWNGRTWSKVSTPSTAPGYGPSGILSAVSCSRPSSCFGAGAYRYPSSGALVERWNGTRWSVVNGPRGARDSWLHGISCTAPSSCVAVGSAPSPNGSLTLTERWNGKGWSVLSSPNRH